ncbi:SpoIIE family protein phosphatase [Streptomyces sp. OF8]|uniref:SpoIIE family protein phosphatase n=3 Tax=Streptomyces alkaliterrae TaxID=2213162 RepID=A0A7W3WWP8_9ACTN|nr:SpoIIE family protein phosphatase [Streptomyces alkaliterrae]
MPRPVGEHTDRATPSPVAQAAAPHSAPAAPGALGTFPRQARTLLVIADDPSAGAASLPALLDAAGRLRVRTARNLTEAARLLTDDVGCVLLDLADGDLDVLREVVAMAPRQAVLVLTDEDDPEKAAEAVRLGAQDQLPRQDLDAALLNRAIRYAEERKRSDLARRQLAESRLRAQENARLERGLLPTPLLDGSGLALARRYRPGRSRALLGGDFYDTVRTDDGTVHAMIGDVSGHGPDEAALGVELRIAWRALIMAGLSGAALLGTLQQVLEHERSGDEVFATLCMIDIAPEEDTATMWLAGHPAPVLADPAPRLLPEHAAGPALGLLPNAEWPAAHINLGHQWHLLMYTDGLIEGRTGDGRDRLGQEGMLHLVADSLHAHPAGGQSFVDDLLHEVRRLNAGELTDDVAMLLLSR